MVSILINIIQHEQYYLIILLTDLKTATLFKKRLWHGFPVNFVKFLGTTLRLILKLSFVNHRKKSVKELVS